IATVDDRRRAVDQQNVDLLADRIADQRRQIASCMRAALLQDQAAAERPQTPLGDLPGLVEDALLEPGKPGLNEAYRKRPERRDPEKRTLGNSRLHAPFDRLLGRAERDDLYGGEHLPGLDDREGR